MNFGRGLLTAMTLAIATMVALCAGCSNGDVPAGEQAAPAFAYSTLEAYAHSDMSGYEAFGPDDETAFVTMTVADIATEMEAGSTFAVFCGFADCPWCNALVPYLNQAALERGLPVGYLDTRANPAWQSNVDIDDYDLFVELFGSYLSDDDEGVPHLYTPFVIFVKDGKAVAVQDGTVSSQEDAHDPLTPEQESELVDALNAKFDLLA